MGLPLDHFFTTLSRRLFKPHLCKLSPKMTVSAASFWIWTFPPVPPLSTASPETLFWTNPFIFLFLAPPTSPISSSPTAEDVSFLRRIWSAHIVKSLLILGITIFSVTTGTIFYTLIWFFPTAFVQPLSLANVPPVRLRKFSIPFIITSAWITSMTLVA